MHKRESTELIPSGYAWLEDIPSNWMVVDFKYLFNICKQVSTIKEPTVLSLGMNGVKIRDTSNNEGQLAASYENYALIKKGQFALNPMDLISGAVAISPYEGVMSNAYKIFTHEGSRYGLNMLPSYYEYLLRYHYDNKVFLPFGKGVGRSESGGGRWTLNTETLSNFPMLLPPLEEQQRIATFLDQETSKIDALSDELTKFKANLQLQKRSLVSECVTKGIPSERDRAYKDSGVEWLGEIPASWELNKLKRMATCHDNLRKPLNAEERGEIQGEYAYWGANSIQDYVNDYLVDGETVLLGEDAAPFFDKIKNVAFYTEAKIWPNNHIHVLKVKDGVNPRYFTEALNTVDYSAYITGSIRDKLTQGAMMRIALPLPPLDEQQRIADYLDVECAKIDALIGEIDNQVNLLKTYRKSLINEVVTGKIEV